MSSTQVIEFYQKVRSTPALWADLAAQPDQDALVARAAAISAEHGYTISSDEIRTSAAHIDELIKEAAGDDTLTDDELELVSAGGVDPSAYGSWS